MRHKIRELFLKEIYYETHPEIPDEVVRKSMKKKSCNGGEIPRGMYGETL